MRVYSDVTKEFYETFSEAEEAEAKFLEEQDKKNRAVELRKTDAKLVETKYQALGSAKKKYSEARAKAYQEFAKKLAVLKEEYNANIAEAEEELTKANDEYQKQLAEFIKEYGSFHATISDADQESSIFVSATPVIFENFINNIFRTFLD